MLPLFTRPSTGRLPGSPWTPRPATGGPGSRVLAATGAAALILLTSACGGGSAGVAATSGGTGSTSVSGATVTAGTSTGTPELTITDAWVKATEGAADPSMTAAFGVLSNATDRTVTVVSAATSASDRTELHEMAVVDGAMVMRPIAGGIVVPAGGDTTLQPGGNHVMIMDVGDPIRPGDQVTVTLTLDDGSTVDFTALAKDFAGAQEEYAGPSGSPSAAMDMSGAMEMSAAMEMSGAAPSSPAAHG